MKIPAWLVTVLLNFLYDKGRELISYLIAWFQNQKRLKEEKKKMREAVAEYKAALNAARDERRRRAKNVLNASPDTSDDKS